MKVLVILLVGACTVCIAATPSPSRAELEAAQSEVREIVSDVLDDLRGGTLTYADAAEAVRIRASQVEKPAEEYLLLQGAFRLFMRAGEYPRAVDLLRHMRVRDFPPEALASLAEQALEPVPRGKPVAGLDALLATLRDEIAHVRKRNAEQELDAGLDGTVPPGFSSERDVTILDVAEGVRACVLERGGPRFNLFVKMPYSGGVPTLPHVGLTNGTLRALLDAACSSGGWTRRVHGRALMFARASGMVGGRAVEIRTSGNADETARKLKECRLGFVAFDASETLPEAAERLFLAVSDRAREGFDMVVFTPPEGVRVPLRTVRAADIALYDALGLLCDAAGYRFEIKGNWAVLSPRP